MRYPSSYLFLLLLLLSGLPACFESEEGCLDIAATNFDASADDPCPDCCTYPSLQLSINHQMGDTVLRFGDPYVTDGNELFRVARIRFYLSELELWQDGQYLGVSDTLVIDTDNGPDTTMLTISDNFALINRNQFNYTFGNVSFNGTFDSLRFKVGLDAQVNGADPVSIPSGHPLEVSTDSMYFNVDSGYVFNQIWLQKDTTANTDTTYLSIGLNERLVEVALPIDVSFSPGFDVDIAIDIDYLTWFTGINFVDDSDDDLVTKIVSNTAQAFSLAE
ncbi:MAG: MbnP family protein [Bacteroidota bacterium]